MWQQVLRGLRGLGVRWQNRPSWAGALLWGGLCVCGAMGYVLWSLNHDLGDRVVLIVPDSLPGDQAIYVNAWKDAGTEEGVPLEVMTATQFSQRSARQSASIRGVILPDTIHRKMGDAFVDHMLGYVRNGGQLMLVYDAGALNQHGDYPEPGSRFSALVGLQMMEYGRMREALNRSITLHGQPELFDSLHVPPGRYRVEEGSPTGRAVVTGYKYDALIYPSLATRGTFPGQKLMESDDEQAVAGVRRFGEGSLLFVNLPLVYLKVRTDGILLHGLLRYFATELLAMPSLSSVPEGVGGLTLNWHCDARICEPAMAKLLALGFFEQGPYSFHITAGPDQRVPGDKLGLDLPNNPAMQQTLKDLIAKGHEVGSHGGWMHDYFGDNVPDQVAPAYKEMLEKNKAAVEAVTGKSQTEYSAPQGRQPQWVTDWLSDTDVQGYYITANMGMGPTRTYHEGVRDDTIWSFPVQNFGRVASVEEAFMQRIPEQEMGDWLVNMVGFVTAQRTTRLVYFHPPGALVYPNAVSGMLESAAGHAQQGDFRWRTMTELAVFLNRRDGVRWTFRPDADQPGHTVLHAEHEWTLDQLTWEFPKKHYGKPRIVLGTGALRERDGVWQVVAGKVTQLTLSVPANPGLPSIASASSRAAPLPRPASHF